MIALTGPALAAIMIGAILTAWIVATIAIAAQENDQ